MQVTSKINGTMATVTKTFQNSDFEDQDKIESESSQQPCFLEMSKVPQQVVFIWKDAKFLQSSVSINVMK